MNLGVRYWQGSLLPENLSVRRAIDRLIFMGRRTFKQKHADMPKWDVKQVEKGQSVTSPAFEI